MMSAIRSMNWFDCANLFAGDGFRHESAHTWPPRPVCEQTYDVHGRGWLDHGLPPQYGCGAEEIVRALVEQRPGAENSRGERIGRRGDIDAC